MNSPRPPTDGPYGAFDDNDPAKKAFFESKAFRRFNRSRKLSEVDAGDYDAILVPGGLGPTVDIQRNAEVQQAIVRAWTTGKLVTTVCHGPFALLGVDLGDGTPFVRGARCFAARFRETVSDSRRQM
ncbi:putative intracellular protease/amidase [Rhizobium sp. BK347]|nr:putative intracellular protease/amidase [Rhizobium sp. BK252]MBB3404562.1 putative intracellular protease/amidase [Rhizobium sp. BK289]MBB3417065.1 putative intracellular protease/amidase [Rhizobium sp. BK284]MBB3484942.1 putative intracellular protease/amidase [Rhizobium sp. BK347]